MDKSKFIPSMFHRRLILLMFCIIMVMGLLSTQLFRLAVIQGDESLAKAEARLSTSSYLPTYRGRILDRNETILALDRPSYDLAVEYDVIVGTWPLSKARRQARRETGSKAWREMTKEQQKDAAEARLPEWEARCEQLWHMIKTLGELDQELLDEKRDRITTRVGKLARDHREKKRIAKGLDKIQKSWAYSEEQQAHVILRSITQEIAFEFNRHASLNEDMIEVQYNLRREYPWRENETFLHRNSLPSPIRSDEVQLIKLTGIADHILGATRSQIWAEDLLRRPFKNSDGEIDLGGYRSDFDDVVGMYGLERAFEDRLRGLRGKVEKNRETNVKTTTDSKPGEDLPLTIDLALQTRIQGILSPEFGLTRIQQWQLGWNIDGSPRPSRLPLGTPLNSAAVVLEVSTGEILAMVTMPTLAMGREMSEVDKKIELPQLNRPYENIYPPGSIIKPLILTAAVMENRFYLDDDIECVGHFFEHSKEFARCWIYREAYNFRTHGLLGPEEAIGRSCNLFFYTLADRLGMEGLITWFEKFGLGNPLDIGLILESDFEKNRKAWNGSFPSDKKIRQLRISGEYNAATVFMGIGQGSIVWTPVQAANAYATLARGGTILDATIVPRHLRSNLVKPREDLNINPRIVTAALEGLRQSVMESHGTGNHISFPGGIHEPIINASGVTVWAKTGTAQAPRFKRDLNHDGELSENEIIEKIDHAWFVGLVGPEGESPKYAISVIVEYGGSGGRTAGPVANQIIRAMQAEGYLPGDHLAPPEYVQ